MKKLILLLIMTIICIVSCNHNSHLKKEETFDSLKTVEIIKQVINPEFKTFDEVEDYRYECIKKHFHDSIFINMSDILLKDVINVCFNKYGYASKESIVQEYINNCEVYDNIHKPYKKPETIEELFEDTLTNKDTLKIIKHG